MSSRAFSRFSLRGDKGFLRFHLPAVSFDPRFYFLSNLLACGQGRSARFWVYLRAGRFLLRGGVSRAAKSVRCKAPADEDPRRAPSFRGMNDAVLFFAAALATIIPMAVAALILGGVQ